MGDSCPCCVVLYGTDGACWIEMVSFLGGGDMEDALKAVAEQIVADVNEASATSDLYLLYDRMVANATDLQRILTAPQQTKGKA